MRASRTSGSSPGMKNWFLVVIRTVENVMRTGNWSSVTPSRSRAGAGAHRLLLDTGLGVDRGPGEIEVVDESVSHGRWCFVEPEPLVEAMQRGGRPPVAFAQQLHR